MTDFYTRIPSELSNYKCDQTAIINKKFLKYISRVNYQEEEPPLPKPLDWYPFTNSYYPYTEDVDAFSRVNHLLGSKPSFESLASIHNSLDSLHEGDAYTERQAQLQYLSTNPVSFLILGKPGIGEQELGKLLAEHWKCVYIDPETLIQEEINSGTRAGECIEFNLRCGRAIGVDIILRLVEKRAKSKSAQHRGFVVCGFPLIPNDLYEEEPVSSESAVFNVREIFEELLDATVEIGVPPPDLHKIQTSKFAEEAAGEDAGSEVPFPGKPEKLQPQDDVPLDIGSATMSNICGPGDMEQSYEEQINFIFNQFKVPFIIIYIMCNNLDVISKHNDYRFDYISQKVVDLQREYSDKLVYTLFTREQGVVNEKLLEDFIDVVKNATPFDIPPARQLLKLPRDFPSNMATLLDRYRYSALPIIERHVLVHDVQHYIKVDGRISPVRMLNAIKTKLRTLPLQKVVLPQKLLVPEVGGEGVGMEDINVDEITLEECFQNFRNRAIACPMFKWTISDWGTKCPVSMKEGEYKDGDAKYAVHFMNKIFFLSDEAAYIKFYRNPRPYLLPPYPKLSCRIFVMGPRCSGKTAVARCLGYVLNGEVLDFNNLKKHLAELKEKEFLDAIRNKALIEGIALLNVMREEECNTKERERQESADAWIEEQLGLLEKYIKLNEELNHASKPEESRVILDVSSFPVHLTMSGKPHSLPELEDSSSTKITKLQLAISELREIIEQNGLAGCDNPDICHELVHNPEMLMEYLPSDLQPQERVIEPATIFDSFVQEFAENAIATASRHDIILSTETISAFVLKAIGDAETRSVECGNNKGGWILDGIPPDQELFRHILPENSPDDIFILRDTQDHEFLKKRFEIKGQNEFRDFRQFFMALGKADAAWRSPSVKSTTSYKTCVAQNVVTDALDEAFFISDKRTEEEDEGETDPYFRKHPRALEREAYEAELVKFDEDWNEILNLLPEEKVIITEIDVSDKSIPDVLKQVTKNVEDRYRLLGSIFTEEERAEELEDFAEPELHGEDMGEGEEKEDTEDAFFQNRRYGCTFNYCPVAFHDHWVLWKGKEEFAGKFENKLYLMCSEDALNSFVENPRHYLTEEASPKLLPPPRLCIVGPRGSGKTTVSEKLSRNLGLYHADYFKLIKDAIAPRSTFGLQEVLKAGLAAENGNAVQNYLTSDDPLELGFLNKIILPRWSEEPTKTFGFVFDGFPMRPSDVAYMTKSFTIPDIVVELTISQGDIHTRLVEKFVEEWKAAQNEKLARERKIYDEILYVWQERRRDRFVELLNTKRQERYLTKTKEEESATPTPVRPYMDDLMEVTDETDTSSHASYDSYMEEVDAEEINRILDQEMPEPVLEEQIEQTLEEATEAFATSLEDSYVTDLDFLRLTRETCEEELIPWITVDAGMSEDKVFAQVMRLVDKFKFRNDSIFERVYDISVELADKLLSTGYYFLSKFGKTCPVQVYENRNPVQMCLPLEQSYQLYPVIHRYYIYFLAKTGNRDKFKEDPLKYTNQTDVTFPNIPLKIAVIGPPKSGKTSLAERFKRELGLKLISIGQAGRYVLDYLQFSELAQNMECVLRGGCELSPEMMIRCVEAVAFDGKSISQGFVFDGFPSSITDAQHLAAVGLIPHLVIDLQAERDDVMEFLSGDFGKRNLPRFSQKFIGRRYREWLETAHSFRDWMDKEYQITAKVPVQPSKWCVWSKSYELATAVFSEVKHYYKYCFKDVALRLANMQVTPLEFVERQGMFKAYCPVCLHYENVLVHGGEPPDRTGLVQFRKYYYYLCPGHISEFIKDPEQFLSPYNNHGMPYELPKRVFMSEFPENCYENRICVICFWDNQPRRVIRTGNIHFMVSYMGKVYVFDNLSCMNKFMRSPHEYFAKTISFKGQPYPSLDYHSLPLLGLIQQYDIKQVTQAVMSTGILRPVIPGLSAETSAAINIGLFLKVNNPRTEGKYLEFYKEAKSRCDERRLNLMTYLARMKEMINPYLYYDEPLPKFVDPLFPPPPPSLQTESSGVGRGKELEEFSLEKWSSAGDYYADFVDSDDVEVVESFFLKNGMESFEEGG